MIDRTIIERAFELARGGDCHSIADIKHALRAEHYPNVEAYLAGPALQKQLKALVADKELDQNAAT